MKRRNIGGMFVLMVALLAAPASVQAQFSYSTNADGITATITGWEQSGGPVGSLIIPTNLGGLTVTSIGAEAFAGSVNLTSVTIAASVTSLGPAAFDYCRNLTNATLPSSLTSIGYEMFAHSSLTSVTIPDSVADIGTNAFAGCAELTSVTIPGSVNSIGDGAFADCFSLASATIAGSVTSIGASAFQSCTDLASLFFKGNAPTADASLFSPVLGPVLGATVYYLSGTTGWSNSFAGRPAVLWNPLIQTGDGSFGVQNGRFGFNITGTPNIPIVVEASSNVAGPGWTPLQNLTLTNGSYYFSEPFQPGSSQRYYRIGSQ